MQRCVRSLMGFEPVQRFAPRLAVRLCGPEKAVAREFVVNFHGFNYRGETKNRNDWCVFFFKKYALAEGKFLESVRDFVKRTDRSFVCYDIGANVGHRTLLMAKLATRVIAAEPVKGAVGRLREKIRENGISNVDVFQVAIDENDGNIEVENLSPANFLVMRRSDMLSKGAFGTEVIHAVNGDRFISRYRLPMPHFIRLNAGRDSLNVLAGLRETLRQAKPIILIECPPVTRGRVIDVEALKASLYDEVEVSTFKECVMTGTFSLEAFDAQARKLVCYPAEIARMAEQEACKRRSLGLQGASGI